RSKHHFQQNFSFQLELACFVRINGIRFISDLNRSSGRPVVHRLLRLHSTLSDLLGAKTCRLNSARATSVGATVGLSRPRDSVPETCAGDNSFNSFCSACAVTRTRAWRHIKRTG